MFFVTREKVPAPHSTLAFSSCRELGQERSSQTARLEPKPGLDAPSANLFLSDEALPPVSVARTSGCEVTHAARRLAAARTVPALAPAPNRSQACGIQLGCGRGSGVRRRDDSGGGMGTGGRRPTAAARSGRRKIKTRMRMRFEYDASRWPPLHVAFPSIVPHDSAPVVHLACLHDYPEWSLPRAISVPWCRP